MPKLETVLKLDKKTYILDLDPRAVLFNNIRNITSIINKYFKVIDEAFYPKNYVSYSTDDLETLKFLATYEDVDIQLNEFKVPNEIRKALINAIYDLATNLHKSGKIYVFEFITKEVTKNELEKIVGKEVSFTEDVQKAKIKLKVYLPVLDKIVWFEEYVEWWKHTSLWVEPDPEPSSDGMRNPKRYGPPRVERCVDYYVKIPTVREASFNDVVEMLLRLIDVIYCAKGICEIIYYGNFGDTCTLYDDVVKKLIEEVQAEMAVCNEASESKNENESDNEETVIDFTKISEYVLEDPEFYDPDYVREYCITKVDNNKLSIKHVEYGEEGEFVLNEFEVTIDKSAFTKDELLQLIKSQN